MSSTKEFTTSSVSGEYNIQSSLPGVNDEVVSDHVAFSKPSGWYASTMQRFSSFTNSNGFVVPTRFQSPAMIQFFVVDSCMALRILFASSWRCSSASPVGPPQQRRCNEKKFTGRSLKVDEP